MRLLSFSVFITQAFYQFFVRYSTLYFVEGKTIESQQGAKEAACKSERTTGESWREGKEKVCAIFMIREIACCLNGNDVSDRNSSKECQHATKHLGGKC